ncbi:MAG: hypothetical protein ACHQQR_04140 [Gemmatimonadales bacterium]
MAFVVAAGWASTMFTTMVQDEVRPLQQANDSVKAIIDTLNTLGDAEVNRLRATAARLQGEIADVEKTIPVREDMAAFLRQLQERAATYSLRVTGITPIANSPLVPPTTRPYAGVPYRVELRGKWFATLEILKEIGQGTHLVVPVVETMTVDSTSGTVNTRLVVTLIARQFNPATPSATAPGAPPPPVVGTPIGVPIGSSAALRPGGRH